MLYGKGDDEPVHYDSRVDKFNKRLQLVRQQLVDGIQDVTEAEVQNVSLYEFWWKYTVFRGRVKRATRPVCLMVTPCYSADCANVEHSCHESYARAIVLAHWRHMATLWRHRRISEAKVEVVPAVCNGGTPFVDPHADALAPESQRYLGTRDLYMKFEGKLDSHGNNVGWTLALMEMLTDPMLKQWVPGWAVEQYERANPFFREALSVVIEQVVASNVALLRRTKTEMVHRHHLHQKRQEMKDKERDASGGESGGGEDVPGDDTDPDEEADKLARRLGRGDGDDDDPNAEPVEMIREPRPKPGTAAEVGEEDAAWAQRGAEERLSAAGAAAQARDCKQSSTAGAGDQRQGRKPGFGVLFNPKNYP
jgi:hypothetical protein